MIISDLEWLNYFVFPETTHIGELDVLVSYEAVDEISHLLRKGKLYESEYRVCFMMDANQEATYLELLKEQEELEFFYPQPMFNSDSSTSSDCVYLDSSRKKPIGKAVVVQWGGEKIKRDLNQEILFHAKLSKKEEEWIVGSYWNSLAFRKISYERGYRYLLRKEVLDDYLSHKSLKLFCYSKAVRYGIFPKEEVAQLKDSLEVRDDSICSRRVKIKTLEEARQQIESKSMPSAQQEWVKEYLKSASEYKVDEGLVFVESSRIEKYWYSCKPRKLESRFLIANTIRMERANAK